MNHCCLDQASSVASKRTSVITNKSLQTANLRGSRLPQSSELSLVRTIQHCCGRGDRWWQWCELSVSEVSWSMLPSWRAHGTDDMQGAQCNPDSKHSFAQDPRSQHQPSIRTKLAEPTKQSRCTRQPRLPLRLELGIHIAMPPARFSPVVPLASSLPAPAASAAGPPLLPRLCRSGSCCDRFALASTAAS